MAAVNTCRLSESMTFDGMDMACYPRCYLKFAQKAFSDDRGFFFESFNQKVFEQATGQSSKFVQDNHSKSGKGVLFPT